MDSFGDRLRQTREKLTLSVEQVSRDTHIAKRYIEGLEREDFSGFPGETYTMGFLRNYAMYLGLAPDEMVVAYRNLRIQEQPVPMTELLEDRKGPKNLPLVVIVAASVVVVAGLVYGVTRLASRGRPSQPTTAQSGARTTDPKAGSAQAAAKGATFVLEEPAVVRWFSPGDRITVPFGSARFEIKVVRIEKDVYLELPGGVEILAVGDKKRLDVDNDGKIDLQIQLNSVDSTTGERKANIGLYKIAKAADEPREAASTDTSGAVAVEGTAPSDGESVSAPVRRLNKPVVTFREAEAPGPFSLVLSFSGRCLFRFQVDNAERETRLFLKGGAFQIEAEQSLKLWVSNAGVVDARVAGKDVELGRQGEVAAVDIHWVRDAQSKKQRLRSFPMF